MDRISITTDMFRIRVKEEETGTKTRRKITIITVEMEDNHSKHLLLLILKTNGTTVAGKRCKTKVPRARKVSSSSKTRERVATEEVANQDSNLTIFRMRLIKNHLNSSRKMISIRILIKEIQVVKKDPSN